MTADERQRLAADQALEAEIIEWERKIVNDDPHAIRIGQDDCPLCVMFINRNCFGCPVPKRTGGHDCDVSPYWNAADALYNWKLAVVLGASDCTKERDAWQEAAQAEIDFLKSCRRSAK